MREFHSVIVLLAITLSLIEALPSPLISEFAWKYFDYQWKTPEQKDSYVKRGLYNPKKLIPYDMDRSKDGRTFITIANFDGVPATVNTLADDKAGSGPLLKPYPDWSWYENRTKCESFTNVYKISIDQCNRLWILDSGIFNSKFICQARLYAFDLSTNQVVKRIEIPNRIGDDKQPHGILVNPLVETYGEKCENTTVYMADVTGGALVIWNGTDSVRLDSDVFKAEEQYTRLNISGQSLRLDHGITGMSLSPIQPQGNRFLSFRPLASLSLFGIDTRDLKGQVDGSKVNFYKNLNVLPSQSTAQVFSSNGTLLYALPELTAVGCWHMFKPLEPQYFLTPLKDSKRLQFVSGMKIINYGSTSGLHEETLLLLTNRLQKVVNGDLNLEELNFRILRAAVKSIVNGTICDKPEK